ncbi:MAG TPA: MotA/TolQ/ExbB proton channel family protein [Terriglobia bacterium]|nr:MotA/TolQ/ExbB proton channel family protein [Terriglobia bacterium]
MLNQSDIGLVSMLQNTGTTSKIVLSILLILSVWSWGIILAKALLLRRVRAESDIFWRIFRKGKTLSEIGTAVEALRFTPLVPVFNSGVPFAAKKSPNTSVLERVMQRTATSQLTTLESRLTFLATTASAAPFVGLFGTVVGVLTAFLDLSNADSASLKAVGPGIADALLATALGLFAAIPAVVAYNQFVYRLRNIGGQLDDLQAEMLNIVEDGE